MMSDWLISGVFLVPESSSRRRRAHLGPDLPRWNGRQVSYAHQIVGGASEGKDPVHFADPTMAHLPHQCNRLQPTKAFFDPFPLSLADRISRVACGAAINCASAWPRVVLRDVGRDPEIPTLSHKPARVKPFVATHRHRLRSRNLFQHHQRRI